MRISDDVLRVIQAEGISEAELASMVEDAAITSLRGFNRRFFHWVFKVQGGALLAMQYAEYIEIGSGDVRMVEEHDGCGGEGCHGCGWIGQIGRWISDKRIPAGHHPLPSRRMAS